VDRGVDLIDLAQDMENWSAVVKVVLNVLTLWRTRSFPRRTFLHGVSRPRKSRFAAVTAYFYNWRLT